MDPFHRYVNTNLATVSFLLHLLQYFRDYLRKLNTFIPEPGNAVLS